MEKSTKHARTNSRLPAHVRVIQARIGDKLVQQKQ